MGKKTSAKRKRLYKESKRSQSVPTWVVVRTKRTVRTNPQRRMWRRQKLKNI